MAPRATNDSECAVGGFNKQFAIDILNIPEELWPMLLITVGYPDETPEVKPRRPMSEVAYLDSCNNPWRTDDE